jgi:hypothetical protein
VIFALLPTDMYENVFDVITEDREGLLLVFGG